MSALTTLETDLDCLESKKGKKKKKSVKSPRATRCKSQKKGKIFSWGGPKSQNFSSDLSLSSARASSRALGSRNKTIPTRKEHNLRAPLTVFVHRERRSDEGFDRSERKRIVLHFIFPYRIKCWIRKKVIPGRRRRARARSDRIGSRKENERKRHVLEPWWP